MYLLVFKVIRCPGIEIYHITHIHLIINNLEEEHRRRSKKPFTVFQNNMEMEAVCQVCLLKSDNEPTGNSDGSGSEDDEGEIIPCPKKCGIFFHENCESQHKNMCLAKPSKRAPELPVSMLKSIVEAVPDIISKIPDYACSTLDGFFAFLAPFFVARIRARGRPKDVILEVLRTWVSENGASICLFDPKHLTSGEGVHNHHVGFRFEDSGGGTFFNFQPVRTYSDEDDTDNCYKFNVRCTTGDRDWNESWIYDESNEKLEHKSVSGGTGNEKLQLLTSALSESIMKFIWPKRKRHRSGSTAHEKHSPILNSAIIDRSIVISLLRGCPKEEPWMRTMLLTWWLHCGNEGDPVSVPLMYTSEPPAPEVSPSIIFQLPDHLALSKIYLLPFVLVFPTDSEKIGFSEAVQVTERLLGKHAKFSKSVPPGEQADIIQLHENQNDISAHNVIFAYASSGSAIVQLLFQFAAIAIAVHSTTDMSPSVKRSLEALSANNSYTQIIISAPDHVQEIPNGFKHINRESLIRRELLKIENPFGSELLKDPANVVTRWKVASKTHPSLHTQLNDVDFCVQTLREIQRFPITTVPPGESIDHLRLQLHNLKSDDFIYKTLRKAPFSLQLLSFCYIFLSVNSSKEEKEVLRLLREKLKSGHTHPVEAIFPASHVCDTIGGKDSNGLSEMARDTSLLVNGISEHPLFEYFVDQALIVNHPSVKEQMVKHFSRSPSSDDHSKHIDCGEPTPYSRSVVSSLLMFDMCTKQWCGETLQLLHHRQRRLNTACNTKVNQHTVSKMLDTLSFSSEDSEHRFGMTLSYFQYDKEMSEQLRRWYDLKESENSKLREDALLNLSLWCDCPLNTITSDSESNDKNGTTGSLRSKNAQPSSNADDEDKTDYRKIAKLRLERQFQEVEVTPTHFQRELLHRYREQSNESRPYEDAANRVANAMRETAQVVEVINSDAFTFNEDLLRSFIGERKVFVVGVMGTQSAGKSTVLNYVMRLYCATSAAACTKGVFGALLPLDEMIGDASHLLVLDVEGMEGAHTSGSRDQRMMQFVMSACDVVLYVTSNNLSVAIEMLPLVMLQIEQLHENEFPPDFMFVFNKQPRGVVAEATGGKGSKIDYEAVSKLTEEVDKVITGCESGLAEMKSNGDEKVNLSQYVRMNKFPLWLTSFHDERSRIDFANYARIVRGRLLNILRRRVVDGQSARYGPEYVQRRGSIWSAIQKGSPSEFRTILEYRCHSAMSAAEYSFQEYLQNGVFSEINEEMAKLSDMKVDKNFMTKLKSIEDDLSNLELEYLGSDTTSSELTKNKLEMDWERFVDKNHTEANHFGDISKEKRKNSGNSLISWFRLQITVFINRISSKARAASVVQVFEEEGDALLNELRAMLSKSSATNAFSPKDQTNTTERCKAVIKSAVVKYQEKLEEIVQSVVDSGAMGSNPDTYIKSAFRRVLGQRKALKLKYQYEGNDEVINDLVRQALGNEHLSTEELYTSQLKWFRKINKKKSGKNKKQTSYDNHMVKAVDVLWDGLNKLKKDCTNSELSWITEPMNYERALERQLRILIKRIDDVKNLDKDVAVDIEQILAYRLGAMLVSVALLAHENNVENWKKAQVQKFEERAQHFLKEAEVLFDVAGDLTKSAKAFVVRVVTYICNSITDEWEDKYLDYAKTELLKNVHLPDHKNPMEEFNDVIYSDHHMSTGKDQMDETFVQKYDASARHYALKLVFGDDYVKAWWRETLFMPKWMEVRKVMANKYENKVVQKIRDVAEKADSVQKGSSSEDVKRFFETVDERGILAINMLEAIANAKKKQPEDDNKNVKGAHSDNADSFEAAGSGVTVKGIGVIVEQLRSIIVETLHHWATLIEREIRSSEPYIDELGCPLFSYTISLDETTEKVFHVIWEKRLGCKESCPYCGQSCQHIEHDVDQKKHSSTCHGFRGMTGWKGSLNHAAAMEYCTMATDHKMWGQGENGPELFTFQEHNAKFHSDWKIDPTDRNGQTNQERNEELLMRYWNEPSSGNHILADLVCAHYGSRDPIRFLQVKHTCDYYESRLLLDKAWSIERPSWRTLMEKAQGEDTRQSFLPSISEIALAVFDIEYKVGRWISDMVSLSEPTRVNGQEPKLILSEGSGIEKWITEFVKNAIEENGKSADDLLVMLNRLLGKIEGGSATVTASPRNVNSGLSGVLSNIKEVDLSEIASSICGEDMSSWFTDSNGSAWKLLAKSLKIIQKGHHHDPLPDIPVSDVLKMRIVTILLFLSETSILLRETKYAMVSELRRAIIALFLSQSEIQSSESNVKFVIQAEGAECVLVPLNYTDNIGTDTLFVDMFTHIETSSDTGTAIFNCRNKINSNIEEDDFNEAHRVHRDGGRHQYAALFQEKGSNAGLLARYMSTSAVGIDMFVPAMYQRITEGENKGKWILGTHQDVTATDVCLPWFSDKIKSFSGNCTVANLVHATRVQLNRRWELPNVMKEFEEFELSTAESKSSRGYFWDY